PGEFSTGRGGETGGGGAGGAVGPPQRGKLLLRGGRRSLEAGAMWHYLLLVGAILAGAFGVVVAFVALQSPGQLALVPISLAFVAICILGTVSAFALKRLSERLDRLERVEQSAVRPEK